MKIGLFIDIDGVCTEEPINLQYARLLGIEKENLQYARLLGIEKDHLELEKIFNENKISTEEFGRRLVSSFRSKKFTNKWAIENFENIRLRVYSSDLFKIFEDVYIVSSAPSYFIKPFAKKISIPEERFICSEYDFDSEGLLSKCSCPVSAMTKGDFVKKISRQYQISIGIGDIPEQDGIFLGHCNIRILMQEFRAGYLSVREIEPIIGLILVNRVKICWQYHLMIKMFL
jgi:phosphoserine phosphatase